MPLGESINGVPERNYHGVIPASGPKRVIIKEQGLNDAYLQGVDGSVDFNWGYGGGGPERLAEALAADAFDDVNFAEVMGFCFRDNLLKVLQKDKGFVLSRDRLVLEGLLHLNNWANATGPDAALLRRDIKEMVAKRDEVRKKMLGLLSTNALVHLMKSGYGVTVTEPRKS